MTDLASRFHDAPLSDALQETLNAQGLRAHRADDAVRAEVDPWLDAVARGFLDGERSDVQHEEFFSRTAQRRKVGVYDDAGAQPEVPIATFASWGAELTLPGGTVPACAISSVTVAPTHRRRGILRSVMTGELQVARAEGFPVAALTVSESGIYGRFGFGVAATAAHWKLDLRRAGWRGPRPTGRLDFVAREQGRALAPALHDRIRVTAPGEIDMPAGHWDRFFGTRADVEKPGDRRVVRFTSDAGEAEGLAVYSVTENHEDYASSSVDIALLLAATDDAYAALWHFFLTMDLIGQLRIGELSVDEPVWWMLRDQRAATITVTDHHYLRVLDVAAALEARTYDVADSLTIEVTDPLGIAGGVFRLRTDDAGVAAVEPVPTGEPVDAVLAVEDLSAILLGGTSALTLARAGRVRAADPARLARLFGGTIAPRLSYWY